MNLFLNTQKVPLRGYKIRDQHCSRRVACGLEGVDPSGEGEAGVRMFCLIHLILRLKNITATLARVNSSPLLHPLAIVSRRTREQG